MTDTTDPQVARLTAQQLDEIDARVQAATASPWTVSEDYSDVMAPTGDQLASYWREADGQFIAHARQDVPALLAEVRRLKAELADAVLAVLPATTDRASEIRAAAFKVAANYVRGHSADERYGKASISTALCAVSDELRRMADQATAGPGRVADETRTPCGPAPDQCDPESGERCDVHEVEQAHAEGDHEHCGITCQAEFTEEKLRNGILWRAAPGSPAMLAELLRRAAAGQPAVVSQPGKER